MRRLFVAALALLAACSPQPKAADPNRPDGYDLRLTVNPASGGGAQRILLPPAALAAMKKVGADDVRLFDGDGHALSLGRADDDGLPRDARSNKVEAIPIAVPKPNEPSSVSVKVEQDVQKVTVDAVNQEADAEAHPVAALLLDTRKLVDPAVALSIDTKIAKGALVELKIESSSDLKTWEPVASKMLLGSGLEDEVRSVPLPQLALKDHYLRVSWTLDDKVAIRAAEVVTSARPPLKQITFATIGAKLDGPRSLVFKVPLVVPLAEVRVRGQAGEDVIPLTLEARAGPEAPWHELGRATLHNGSFASLDAAGSIENEYRITADPRSPGFSDRPQLELVVQPLVLLASFTGKGPYALAVGNANAPGKLLPAVEFALPEGAKQPFPEASVAAVPEQPLLVAPTPPASPLSPRKLALWGALLAATLVLAFAALRLIRASVQSKEGEMP